MDDHAALTVQNPVFDRDGMLEWNLDVEEVFRRNADDGGKCSVLLSTPNGPRLAILMGLNRQGAHRLWEIRTALLPNDGDDGALYSIDFDYDGERAPGKMYPRLPYHDRVTGVLSDYGEIVAPLEKNFARVDADAEEVYNLAVADTRKHMAGVMDEFLRPKPWWKFW